MDFELELSQTAKIIDLAFIVVDSFSKMAYFMSYNKTLDVPYVPNLFLREVVRLDGVPKTINRTVT